ncbi:MAG: hypothetical protein HYX72_03380 [Acidobacteria bacterium]|nr:hypothetical protein [Acidobacteriota bacterium]
MSSKNSAQESLTADSRLPGIASPDKIGRKLAVCPRAGPSDDGGRCEKCPLNRLDAAQHSEAGQLLRRAIDLRAALRLGVSLSLDDIAAEEFFAMLAIEEAQDEYETGRRGKS